MSEPVKAALTSEEWARRKVFGDPFAFSGGYWPFTERRHAVAALALFEQPYGFTHAQVVSLLRVIQAAADTMVETEDYEAALALVLNVCALLPTPVPVPPEQPSNQQD